MPNIPEAQRTPLVEQLIEIIRLQQERIGQLQDQVRLQQERIGQLQERVHQLEDEIARLKGLKTRPRIAPTSLETPTRPTRDPHTKHPGSAKRSKTAQLTITEEFVIPLAHRPEGTVFKGYEDFVVQDLTLKPRVILYCSERWQTIDGRSLVAPLPATVVPGSHFGPDLICFILHQYHYRTQRTGFPSIDGVLHGMRAHQAALLRVLDRPEIPLHTNRSEGHLRDYVKKRKISGSTRSEAGRQARDTFASLKKTCWELGVNFWAYLQDRVRGTAEIPRLAALIRRKAEETTARKAAAAHSRRRRVAARWGNAEAIAPRNFSAIPACRPGARHGCPELLRSYCSDV